MGRPKTVDPNRTCKVPGCDKTNIAAHGLCWMHYNRQRNNGRLDRDPKQAELTCSVEGCTLTAVTKGMCTRHYHRYQKHGDPHVTFVIRLPDELCLVDGCGLQIYNSDHLCHKHHYNHMYHLSKGRYENMADYLAYIAAREKLCTCAIEGCDEEGRDGSSLCVNHYANYYYYKRRGVVEDVPAYIKFKEEQQ